MLVHLDTRLILYVLVYNYYHHSQQLLLTVFHSTLNNHCFRKS